MPLNFLMNPLMPAIAIPAREIPGCRPRVHGSRSAGRAMGMGMGMGMGGKVVERANLRRGWLPDMDLNHDKQIQSLLCYRYTIGQ